MSTEKRPSRYASRTDPGSVAQRFRVTVKEAKTDGGVIDHEFEPASEDVTLRHLGEFPVNFIDETSSVISGTVSHASFDAGGSPATAPTGRRRHGRVHVPVDGAKMFIRQASGAEEPVPMQSEEVLEGRGGARP